MASNTIRRPGRRPAALEALLGVVVLSTVGLAGCGVSGAPSPSPASAVAPSAQPSVAAATPSATVSPSVTASAAPSVVAAIPDGTWLSDPIPVATVRSMIEHANIPAADRERALTADFGVTATTRVITEQVVLDNGSWVESGSWDGAPMSVGARGTYAFPDATTIAMQDNVSLITYRVALTGTTLRLTMLSDSGWTGNIADDVEPAIVFCTAAFHRQG